MNNSNEMVLEGVTTRITELKLSRAKEEESPIVMSLGLKFDPLPLARLGFMLPAKPLALWDSHGNVDEKSPSAMAMKYETHGAHELCVDDTIDFSAQCLTGFKATPVENKQLSVTCTMKVLEPDQQLIMLMAMRIKAPMQLDVTGAVPDDQQELDL